MCASRFLQALVLFVAAVVAGGAESGYVEDRQFLDVERGPLEVRLQRVYVGLQGSNTCLRQPVEQCLKQRGKPDERRSSSPREERLIYYGKKTLYVGSGASNSAVGPEWREYVVRDGVVVDESAAVQIVEMFQPFALRASSERFCEVYGEKRKQQCPDVRVMAPLPNLPAFPALSREYTDEEALRVYMLVVFKHSCDAALPGFQASSAAAYDRWRQANGELVRVFESRAWVRAANRDQTEPEREQMREQCELILAEFARPATPDPRLSTPEGTWNTFQTALRNADVETAIACLTSSARQKFAGPLQEMSKADLKRMAAAVKQFSLVKRSETLSEGLAVRHDGQAGFIYFQKQGEEWKIGEM